MDAKILLKIANDAIEEEFTKTSLVNKDKLILDYPALSKKGAVFVTLTQKRNLCGCIGSLIATRSLLEDVIHHAKNAAFNDARFYPLAQYELEKQP